MMMETFEERVARARVRYELDSAHNRRRFRVEGVGIITGRRGEAHELQGITRPIVIHTAYFTEEPDAFDAFMKRVVTWIETHLTIRRSK